jgi:hypothetical protein
VIDEPYQRVAPWPNDRIVGAPLPLPSGEPPAPAFPDRPVPMVVPSAAYEYGGPLAAWDVSRRGDGSLFPRRSGWYAELEARFSSYGLQDTDGVRGEVDLGWNISPLASIGHRLDSGRTLLGRYQWAGASSGRSTFSLHEVDLLLRSRECFPDGPIRLYGTFGLMYAGGSFQRRPAEWRTVLIDPGDPYFVVEPGPALGVGIALTDGPFGIGVGTSVPLGPDRVTMVDPGAPYVADVLLFGTHRVRALGIRFGGGLEAPLSTEGLSFLAGGEIGLAGGVGGDIDALTTGAGRLGLAWSGSGPFGRGRFGSRGVPNWRLSGGLEGRFWAFAVDSGAYLPQVEDFGSATGGGLYLRGEWSW